MPRIHTATTELVGKVNRTVISELLRERGALTRTEIAELSGLSSATVNRLVADLLRERVAVLESHAASTGGRPARLVRYNASYESVIVVDVGATETRGAISDLTGTFLHREVRPTGVSGGRAGGDAAARGLLDLVSDLQADANRRNVAPRGIAVGVPSVVRASGLVEWAPALGWRELPLGDLIRSATSLATFIENDVNLLALGEHRRGAGVGTRTMAALAIEAGLGGGLIIEGQLFRGANSAAGEAGYLLTDLESLNHIYPGFGDLEGHAAGIAIAERAAEVGFRGPSRVATAPDVFRAAQEGDPEASAIVSDVVDLLAMAAGNIGTLLDPELIVIGGSVVGSLEVIAERVASRLVGRVPHPPRISPSLLGDEAVLVGAAALAIEQTSDYAFFRPPNPAAGTRRR